MIRHYFRDRRTVAATLGTTDNVTWGPVLTGRIYHITELAVEDETSAPSTDVRVVVTGHGFDFPLVEQDLPAAATLYWSETEHVLSEAESLVARFRGATAADRLQLYVSGWWEEVGEVAAGNA